MRRMKHARRDNVKPHSAAGVVAWAYETLSGGRVGEKDGGGGEGVNF
jgi:hypothetical protein